MTFFQKVKHFFQAFKGGLHFASKDVTSARRSICNGCEIRDQKLNICTACGCFIPAKTKLRDEVCPLEKW